MVNLVEDMMCGKFYEETLRMTSLNDEIEIKKIADKDARDAIAYVTNWLHCFLYRTSEID